MGAIQAQEYRDSKWGVGLRMQRNSLSERNESSAATDSIIEQVFNDGSILRTHVMRPTWHFVMPDDIRWLLELTAPRVHTGNLSIYRKLELDHDLLVRCLDVIVNELRGNRWCTRKELGEALAERGIFAQTQRLSYILMYAELEGIVCSGPRRGNQFTYSLLDERAPDARRLQRDEALSELTRRYFTSHGPATIQDFTWWSGLTVADAKNGLEMVGSNLDMETLADRTYYFAYDMVPISFVYPSALLLPTYDELIIGYSMFNKSRTGGQDISQPPLFYSMIVSNGKIIGSWRRTIKKDLVEIEIAPFSPLNQKDEEAVAAACRRYGEFFGLPVEIRVKND